MEPKYEEMFIHEILGGKEGTGFRGIFTLVRQFMSLKNYSEDHVTHIEHLLHFVSARAAGDIPTGANFIRSFI